MKERLARFLGNRKRIFPESGPIGGSAGRRNNGTEPEERQAMKSKPFRRFEPLENRMCLSVSVAVTDGDLVVSGDADGAVEIVAVSDGVYRVTDNGGSAR